MKRLEAQRLTRLSCKKGGIGFAEAYKLEGVFIVFVRSTNELLTSLLTCCRLLKTEKRPLYSQKLIKLKQVPNPLTFPFGPSISLTFPVKGQGGGWRRKKSR
jgi:hypothetical protein